MQHQTPSIRLAGESYLRNTLNHRGAAFRVVAALVLLSVVFAGSPAIAQDTGVLEGQVSSAVSSDFVLSTARIPDLSLKVDIESDGSFKFDAVRPGTYLLEVRVPSLGVVGERVEIKAGETTSVDITLIPGSHSEEIVVTGTGIARDPNELASPTISLSGQELDLRLEGSLGETLANEPGISSSYFGPGASRPVIRGQAGDRVRMLESGIGTGDVSGVSVDHAVTTDPAQAERIEVIRGPGTLLYGSSAIGGVVNVIDERIPTVRATGGVHGSVMLRGGTVDDERYGSVNLNGGSGDWAWHVDASIRETDDYEIPGFASLDGDEHEEHEEEEHEEEEHEEHEEEEPAFGVVPNTNIETQSVRAGATYFFGDRGFLGVSVSGFETDYGLPGGLEHAEHGDEHGDEHDDDEHDDDDDHEEHEDEEHEEHDEHEEGVPVRIDMEQQRFDLRGQVNQPFNGFQAFKVRIGATDYEHIEFEGDEQGTFFFNEYLEARFELVQNQRATGGGGLHTGSFGLQYSDRDLEAIGAEAFIPKTATERWAVFTLQEIETGPVSWQFGGRFESQDSDPTGAGLSSRSHEGFSASLGLVWQANETFSIAGSLARSVKLPAAEELFANGPHIATQAFEIGDPNLDEEIGLGLDVSLRFETERFSGELTLFRQDFDDYIFMAFTGEEEDGFPVVIFRQQDAEFDGAEFRGRIELYEEDQHHVHLSLMGDVVNAELDAGGNLPRIPPMRLGGGIHYHSDSWNASAEVRWVDDQTDVGVNETPTDGYTLFNASLGYRLLFGNQIVDFLLRGRNLGDEDARLHTSFLKNVAPLPGRNVTLSARLQF
ncbi:MAG: TonB-dependent receptor [Acidobacteriota bacterium]